MTSECVAKENIYLVTTFLFLSLDGLGCGPSEKINCVTEAISTEISRTQARIFKKC